VIDVKPTILQTGAWDAAPNAPKKRTSDAGEILGMGSEESPEEKQPQ
jgi:hypothetical protein